MTSPCDPSRESWQAQTQSAHANESARARTRTAHAASRFDDRLHEEDLG